MKDLDWDRLQAAIDKGIDDAVATTNDELASRLSGISRLTDEDCSTKVERLTSNLPSLGTTVARLLLKLA
jgi:hypothetical protein